jgi:long-chain acyl-CoA synthetase
MQLQAEPAVEGAAPWWRPRAALRRYLGDLLADELARQRRALPPQALPWPDALSLTDDLGVDSLELLALATAVAEALHLHESGVEDYLLARRRLGDWVDIAETGLDYFAHRLTFRTSGSTGGPKACVHPLGGLLQETRCHAALFAGRRRVLAAVPAHHIYGFLFTVLLPQALGLPPEAVVDVRGSSPAWLAQKAQPGDLVIAHPDWWQAVGRTVPRLAPDVIGVTSTAPCADAVSEGALRSGLAALFHVYGSSETAGIGWRASHAEPYALFPHWSFAPDDSALVRQWHDGSHETFAAQDALGRLEDGRFHLGPRHDAAVQVGGINVFPARVREVLREHPLVQDAAVRLMRPEEGARLKAYVVPRQGTTAQEVLLEQLRGWIDTRLTVAERPKAITVGQNLPLTRLGKLADWDTLW